ncbi:hypothetical protein PQX77_016843 [Marasmius sp. AFHP31]|nr:hypothetical protein PQX77_016843 [Marasmius sp. AFHP31]
MPSLTGGKNAADVRKVMVKNVRAKLGETEVLFKGSFDKGRNLSEDSNNEGKDGNEGDTSVEEDGSKVVADLPVRPVGPSADASRRARRTPSPEKRVPLVPSGPSPLQPSSALRQPTTPVRPVFPAARRTPSPDKKLAPGSSSPTRSKLGSPSRSPTRTAHANPSDNGGVGKPSSTSSPSKGKKAYVLYKGSRPSVYSTWNTIKKELDKQKDAHNVFKGFDSFEEVSKAFRTAKNSRVVEELKAEPPSDSQLVYEMLRDGLGWHGGLVHSFVDKEEAEMYWDEVLEDNLCVNFDDPGHFDSSGTRIS